MAPIPELSSPQLPPLGFSISHQKIELDIDLYGKSLKGRTQLTINPHCKDLRIIRLNCRQCELTRLTVNGRPCSSATYEDPYGRATLPWKATVNQYYMLQQKLEGSLKETPEEELIITIPKSIKIDELDPFSEEAQNLLLSKTLGSNKADPGDGTAISLTQNSKIAVEQTARFTPITLNIDYKIKSLRDGLHFVGWEEGDLQYPHVYSTNSLFPGAACCLFPCLDDLRSRCTWEIAIKCQQTLGDALRNTPNNTNSQSQVKSFQGMTNGVNGDHQTPHSDSIYQDFSEEDRALDLAVICTGDMTDEIRDPQDPTRKTTSFICTTAISAQHVGFCIGPFEHVDLAEFRESDEDDKLGQNAVPIHGFCLPGRNDDLKNTCLPMAKAVDFFTITYGSYPFSNYKLCFVDDLYPDILHTGSLSICSNRLLFPESIVEPLNRVSRQLVHALASQWIGIDIIPKDPSDTWVIVGIAYFITDVFIKKLSGNNEYRYNQKMAADRVVKLDVNRPSLFDTGALIKVDRSELEFMELKAPLVLFILDRRLSKAGGSSGLSRIVSRVFLNAKVGDLPNGAIDTPSFVKTCEKLGHLKLDVFIAQWVEGAGCPNFSVTQRFNKKKLVVEMMITQVQDDNNKNRDLESRVFMRDVKEERKAVYAGPVQHAFTGPMTIRIHEADGTPYEHIVEIKEAKTTFDIPYNTKYKRLKRSRRQKERTVANAGIDYAGDGTDDTLLYSLGDILQSEEETKQWRLSEWTRDDEEKMNQESYEWIRMDADFEWICKMSITMQPWMFVSQLQQDRDVVAQLESIQWIGRVKPHPLVSTIFLRTLMDHRYFHGIRTTAAACLARNASEEFDWIGQHHLEKAFQELFCYRDAQMTRPNDFSDRALYYIQCAIPQSIAKIRDANGKSPIRARKFLLEKLKFNDNSNNEFSDCHYLAILMKALAEAVATKPAPTTHNVDDFEDDNGDDQHFHMACLEEIDRYRRIDEWIPSYHNILSTTALDCKQILAKAGIVDVRASDFLQYTPDGNSEYLRLNAFANLMDIGITKKDPVFRWFLFVLGTDPSTYVREHMIALFGKTLGAIAIGENSEAAVAKASQYDNLIIEQDSSTEERKAELARKQTVHGALSALKTELGANDVLKKELWNAIKSPTLSLQQMWELLEICDLLYLPKSEMVISLKYPRYWQCKKVGKGKVLFSRTDRVRTNLAPKRQLPPPIATTFQPPPTKREHSGTNMLPPNPQRKLFKPPKKPMVQTAKSSSSVESVPQSPGAGVGAEGEGPKQQKIKLTFSKLKAGGSGGSGAGSP